MAALIIVNSAVHDAEALDAYRHVAGPVLRARGSTTIVNTSDTIDLGEGPGAGHQTVVLRFDSVEAARAAWYSDEYQAALPARLAASTSHSAILVETLPGVDL